MFTRFAVRSSASTLPARPAVLRRAAASNSRIASSPSRCRWCARSRAARCACVPPIRWRRRSSAATTCRSGADVHGARARRAPRALVRQRAAYEPLRGDEIEPGAGGQGRRRSRALRRAAPPTPSITRPARAGWARLGDGARWWMRSCACAASQGLRVADASIMPEVVNATTHAACVMIGEKAADLLRG